MVYRGRPSAGCDSCRRAKKSCSLERPACERCVKLGKLCSGYRDTTQLLIQDESEAVKRKAERDKAKVHWRRLSRTNAPSGLQTPGSTTSESSSSSDTSLNLHILGVDLNNGTQLDQALFGEETGWGSLMIQLKPKLDDVAITYFYDSFTSSSQWAFLRGLAQKGNLDPCLSLSIKACGLAALNNQETIVYGKACARAAYVEALSLLNEALRDAKRCSTDESLIAVALLRYFENLTCDGRPSIQSWKAHVNGAAQLLRLRGRAQFRTNNGRMLFRETRAQILINCIWEDLKPPGFLLDFQDALEMHSNEPHSAPVDSLTSICIDLAILRARIRDREIADIEAAEEGFGIEKRFNEWEKETIANNKMWRYSEIEVPDSPHVWNRRVHSFAGHPAPTPWNTYRSMRIMLSRNQELLCHRLPLAPAERKQQMQHFSDVRRRMTDEICASIPAALGHASPAYNSPCTLITAYGAIWPLFFACTCALERAGPAAWSILNNEPPEPWHGMSAVAAQATWVLGRLGYISQHIGVKWADCVVAVLKGHFTLLKDRGLAIRDPYITASEKVPWMGRNPSVLSYTLAKQLGAREDGARLQNVGVT